MRKLSWMFVVISASGCTGFTSVDPASTDEGTGSGATSGTPQPSASTTTTGEVSGSGPAEVTTSGETTSPESSTASSTTDEPAAESEESSTGDNTEGVCGDGRTDRDEICDDANVDELDGCTAGCLPSPFGMSLEGNSQTALAGGSGTETDDNVDLCPAGNVLVGLEGGLSGDGWIGQIRGQCQAAQASNATPPQAGTAGNISLTPLRGGFTAGGAWSSTCPVGQMVVGVSGFAGSVFDGIAIACAGLDTIGPEGAFDLERGDVHPQPLQGSDGGAPLNPLFCPGDSVTTGLRLQTSSFLNRVQLLCQDPVFDY